jgi:hypothetical protein
VREQIGYVPWYFDLPDPRYGIAWQYLPDPKGFHAPFGPTTAEQGHPHFRIAYAGHECQWNGPSWPYATSQTLTGLANYLNGQAPTSIGTDAYFAALRTYTRCHRRQREDGAVVSWIDENLDPYTGDWLSRNRLQSWDNGTWSTEKGGRERGKDYNHSTYCDLIISGLAGLRPRTDDVVELNPLLPPGTWAYFCVDNILYHGRIVTIQWDETGERYGQGQGLRLYIDGRQVAHRLDLGRLSARLG